MFEKFESAPPDPILGLSATFKNDTRPEKINLGVGIYKDEHGRTPLLEAVRQAEQQLLETEQTKAYLPIPGDPDFSAETQRLLFGDGHEILTSDRACTAHTPGGTGALRVGADLIHKFFPEATVWISSPTWANHRNILAAAGVPSKSYPYYDAASSGLDEDAFFEALASIPPGDFVLLHACCHNPTGVDPTPEQWARVADMASKHGWIPFVDFAYQGFGEGVEEDRGGLLALARQVPDLLVASSYSKNMGLYRERVGAFTLVAPDAEAAARAFSQIKIIVRTNYSNPPAHGGLTARLVLQDAALCALWRRELDGMRQRIQSMREQFVAGLMARGVPADFSFITKHKGMFSMSGLSPEQVRTLREEKAVYIVNSGRINLAGITPDNVDYLCDAIAAALGEER